MRDIKDIIIDLGAMAPTPEAKACASRMYYHASELDRLEALQVDIAKAEANREICRSLLRNECKARNLEDREITSVLLPHCTAIDEELSIVIDGTWHSVEDGIDWAVDKIVSEQN